MRSWWWRLVDHRARKVRKEIDRIRGGFSETFYTPNTAPKIFLEERVARFVRQRWDNVRIFTSLWHLSIVEVIYDS